MSKIKITNMFDNCVSLHDIDFSSINAAEVYNNGSFLSADGTIGSYIRDSYDDTINRYLNVRGDLEKEADLFSELLYKNFCNRFPKEVGIWEMQLKLNKNDYSLTIPYIIDYLRDKGCKGDKFGD